VRWELKSFYVLMFFSFAFALIAPHSAPFARCLVLAGIGLLRDLRADEQLEQ
jgi:hypothetical protein